MVLYTRLIGRVCSCLRPMILWLYLCHVGPIPEFPVVLVRSRRSRRLALRVPCSCHYPYSSVLLIVLSGAHGVLTRLSENSQQSFRMASPDFDAIHKPQQVLVHRMTEVTLAFQRTAEKEKMNSKCKYNEGIQIYA